MTKRWYKFSCHCYIDTGLAVRVQRWWIDHNIQYFSLLLRLSWSENKWVKESVSTIGRPRKLLGSRKNFRAKHKKCASINFFAPATPIGTAGDLFHSYILFCYTFPLTKNFTGYFSFIFDKWASFLGTRKIFWKLGGWDPKDLHSCEFYVFKFRIIIWYYQGRRQDFGLGA